MMLRLVMGIVILALSSPNASALTFDTTDVLPDDARSAGLPAASDTWEKSAAPAQVIVAPAALALAPAPVQEPALRGNPLWAIPFTALSGTRERPIFSSSRRPPVPPVASIPVAKPAAVAPKPKDPERPQLSLIGTVASGHERFGIFLDGSTKAALRLRMGEDYQGWKLRSVQGREAILEKDQEAVILALPQPVAAVPPPPPLPPPLPLPKNAGKVLSATSQSWHDRSSH